MEKEANHWMYEKCHACSTGSCLMFGMDVACALRIHFAYLLFSFVVFLSVCKCNVNVIIGGLMFKYQSVDCRKLRIVNRNRNTIIEMQEKKRDHIIVDAAK